MKLKCLIYHNKKQRQWENANYGRHYGEQEKSAVYFIYPYVNNINIYIIYKFIMLFSTMSTQSLSTKNHS